MRFSDGDVDAWVDRVDAIGAHDHARIGGAYHSVRAVPLDQMKRHTASPLHIHLSEQIGRERAVPRGVRHDADAGLRRGRAPDAEQHAGPRHAPHRRRHPADRRGRHLRLLLPDDRARPRRRDRPEPRAARGRQPAHPRQRQPCGDRPVRGDASGRARRAAGHASSAGTGPPPELLEAATRHDSLGWRDAGAIAVGRRADLVTIATDRVRTAGTGADEHTAVFAAVAEDVTHVVVDGRVVFGEGDRRAARSRPGRRDREDLGP